MARSVTCMYCKQEDLNSIPRTSVNHQVLWLVFLIPVLESEDTCIPVDSWAARFRLAY